MYDANEVVVGYGTALPPKNINQQISSFLNRFPHLYGQRFLLFLGRIHPKKGIDLLIDAFASISSADPSLQLLIAGPDQIGLQASLQKRASKLGISNRITWAGMLAGDLKWGAYRCAELFCLPSHQENFGIVVAEALACGLPVSITESVNISSDVSIAGAGIVHQDNVTSTTAALSKWLHMTPAARDEMGRRGKELFSDQFDFSSVAQNLIPTISGA